MFRMAVCPARNLMKPRHGTSLACTAIFLFRLGLRSSREECALVRQSGSGFGGLVVSMLASGTEVRGFKPGRSEKILSMPFAPCRMFKNPVITWKLGHRKNLPAISRSISSIANRGL
jgi:hypothetical protein